MEILITIGVSLLALGALAIGTSIAIGMKSTKARLSKNEAMKGTVQAGNDKNKDKPEDNAKKWYTSIRWMHGTLVGDIVWMLLGLVFINWLWAYIYEPIWIGFWSHKSFWAVHIGILVACVGLKNTRNSIGAGVCWAILITSVLSLVNTLHNHIEKMDFREPVVIEPPGLLTEFSAPAEWSDEFNPKQVYSVTGAKDRWWWRLYRDFKTKELVTISEPLPPGDFKTPEETLSVRFYSKSQALTIKLWPPPKEPSAKARP